MYSLLSVFVAARIFTESLPSDDDIPLLLQKRPICHNTCPSPVRSPVAALAEQSRLRSVVQAGWNMLCVFLTFSLFDWEIPGSILLCLLSTSWSQERGRIPLRRRRHTWDVSVPIKASPVFAHHVSGRRLRWEKVLSSSFRSVSFIQSHLFLLRGYDLSLTSQKLTDTKAYSCVLECSLAEGSIG
jgi:hypothetical protein